MAPKITNIRVLTVESELRFTIQPTLTGKELFDKVATSVSLREIWYFGLQYIDSKGVVSWLKLDKKVLSHDFQKNGNELVTLKFRARFYPEEVSEHLIEEVTQKLFFLQVKELILTEEIYCPPETAVLLASYAMQAKFADFDERNYRSSGTNNERLLPRKVMEQYRLSNEEWERRIITWWKEHQGLSKEDARMEYLKIAQDLEMYGINYFEIRNKRKTELYLGVDALGLNIYEKGDKLVPKIGFPWSEIGNISYDGKKFIIKPNGERGPNVIFYAQRRRINRQILSLCQGNHALYMLRRKPDSHEIQQMKRQAEQKRQMRRQEQERITAERERERRHEEDQNQIESHINGLEQTVQDVKRAFDEQREYSRRVEDDLRRERDDSARREERLIQELKAQQDERHRSLQDLEETNQVAERSAEDIKRKTLEAQRLERELKETTQKVVHAQNDNEDHSDTSNNYEDPRDHFDESDYEDDSINREIRDIPLEANPTASRPEEDRSAFVTRDRTTQIKLETTRKELLERQIKEETHEDKIYRENIIDKGIDKYKTLKKIREGTVKRRIDEFEAM